MRVFCKWSGTWISLGGAGHPFKCHRRIAMVLGCAVCLQNSGGIVAVLEKCGFSACLLFCEIGEYTQIGKIKRQKKKAFFKTYISFWGSTINGHLN